MYFFSCSALQLMYPCSCKLRRATSCKIRSHSQSGAIMPFVQVCFTAIQNATRAMSKINRLVFIYVFFAFIFSMQPFAFRAEIPGTTNKSPSCTRCFGCLEAFCFCMLLATRELCQPLAGGEPEQLGLHLGLCWLLTEAVHEDLLQTLWVESCLFRTRMLRHSMRKRIVCHGFDHR